MPTVSHLSVAPVKGLAVHHPDEIRIERGGVPGNRQFLLLDETGRLFSGIRHGRMVTVVPDYRPEPEHLALRFPDGSVVEDEIRLGDALTVDLWDVPRPSHVVEGPFAAVAAGELALHRALHELDARVVECDASLLHNVNTPADL